MEKKLTEATNEFIDHLEKTGKKASTLGTSRRALDLLIANLGEDKVMSKILPVHISKFFNGDSVLQQPGKDGLKPRASASIKQIRRITRQLLFWSVEQKYIDNAPLPKDEIGLGDGLRDPNQSREEVAAAEMEAAK